MNLSENNYDAATEWLARLRAKNVSSTDHENFALWLMEDSTNKPAFDAMLRIWEDLGVVNQLEPACFFSAETSCPSSAVRPVS
jgi:ferric-dicitrate binding protein FerR (iron transport regulator)